MPVNCVHVLVCDPVCLFMIVESERSTKRQELRPLRPSYRTRVEVML